MDEIEEPIKTEYNIVFFHFSCYGITIYKKSTILLKRRLLKWSFLFDFFFREVELERQRLLAQDKKSKGKKSQAAPPPSAPAAGAKPPPAALKSPRDGAARPPSGKSNRSERGNESPRSSKPEEKV